MKQGGRPRRSEEHPDSLFGEALKGHLRRVKNFTQAELAQESMIAEKTLSAMVKGKRISGTALRRDLRAIIKVLYRKKALHSLAEANELITTLPTVKELDARDTDDAEIIELFKETASETPPTYHHEANVLSPSHESISSYQRDVPPSDQAQTAPALSEAMERRKKRRKRGGRNWLISFVILLIVAIVPGILVKNAPFPWQTETCPDTKDGVTLYVDPHFQGHCHTFPPGDYDLAQFGLDQNVSSLKDPGAAYYVRLIDRTNRPGSFDQDVPQLPADWNDQAHSLHVEKHRQNSCALEMCRKPLVLACSPMSGELPELCGEIGDPPPKDDLHFIV